MRMTVYEGTPKELAQFTKELAESGFKVPIEALENSETGSDAAQEDKGAAKVKDFEEPASVESARRVLGRRPLSPELQIVFRTLHAAYPNYVGGPQLRQACGSTTASFRGMMGAFQNRVVNTKGWDRGYILDWDWGPQGRYIQYRIPDTVREALELENLV